MSKWLYVSCSHGRTQVSDIGHEGGTRVSKGASSVHSSQLPPGPWFAGCAVGHKLDFPNDSAHDQEPHSTDDSRSGVGSGLECGRRLHRRAPTDPRPKGQGGKGASPLLHRLGGWRLPITAERCEADWITTHYPTGWSTWDGPGRRKPDMRPGRAGWCRSPPRAVRTGKRSRWAVKNLNARLAWRNGDHGGRANGDGGLRDVDATRVARHVSCREDDQH